MGTVVPGGVLPTGATRRERPSLSDEERRERARLRARDWYYANTDRARSTRRAWAEKNKGKVEAYNAWYREQNAEHLRRYDRERNATEKRKEQHKRWRDRNSEKVVKRAAEWARKNPEKARCLAANAAHRRRARLRGAVSESVNLFRFRVLAEPICGICGRGLDKKRAEIDHIVPLSKGGGHVWGNLQLAHRECNRKKGASIQDVVFSI